MLREAARRENLPVDKLKGFIYEMQQEGSFNANAIRTGWDKFIRLARTDMLSDSHGKHWVNHPVLDLTLLARSTDRAKRGVLDRIIGPGYQAKSGVTAAKAVADPSYWQHGKLVPTDMMLKANKGGGKGTLAKAQQALRDAQAKMPARSAWDRFKAFLAYMGCRGVEDAAAVAGKAGKKGAKGAGAAKVAGDARSRTRAARGAATTWEEVARQLALCGGKKGWGEQFSYGNKVGQQAMENGLAVDRVVAVNNYGRELVASTRIDSDQLLDLTKQLKQTGKKKPGNTILLSSEQQRTLKKLAPFRPTKWTPATANKLSTLLRAYGRVFFYAGLATGIAPHAAEVISHRKSAGRAVVDASFDLSGLSLIGDVSQFAVTQGGKRLLSWDDARAEAARQEMIAKWAWAQLKVENYAIRLYNERLGPGAECVVEKVVDGADAVRKVSEKAAEKMLGQEEKKGWFY